MKLRIDVEKKSYEVTVEFLPEAGNGRSSGAAEEITIPESVTRPRPHLKLLEDTFCRAPISGRITAVLGQVGQAIRKNEPVLVIEAMKMEIQIGPAVDGVLKAIQVKPGETVNTGQLLFELV